MKIQVPKTMLMSLFTGALATLASPVWAADYTTIAWKGEVTSGVYTDDANWTGDVAPKDGVLGYFNNVTGNPDITLDFTQGVSENSSTWMRVPNSTKATDVRTITMDASNGGWWEKPAYDYSANAENINYVGPIFGDGNSTPKSTMFSMVRSTTTDFTKTLFKMTNAVVRFGGNKTLMTLEFEGGPIDFWNPAGELEPLESARPSILSGYGSFGPNRITLKAGSSVRTGLWTADANGGDSSIVIEGGDHFFSSWKLLDENATANRLDVSILGGKVEIGDALVTCAGAKAAKGGQSVGLVVSNAELTVGGSISPACGDVNHRSEILIGGSSVVRAKGLNGKTATSGNSPTGSSSAIEVAGTAKLVVSETPYIGRHPNGVQTVRIAEAGRFECEDGAEALQIGYNANFTSGVTTGILELVDHASCKATECTVGGTAASTQAAYGRVILSDKAAFVVPMTADINVGHKQRASGKGYFEVLDEAVVTGRHFVVGYAGEGTLALKGGIAAVSKIYGRANGTLIADGGTFAVQASGKTMYDFGAAKLGAKGLAYDSDLTTNMSQAFEDLDGETDGLFAKTGTGALTVNANSTHAKTEIRGGSLVLGSGVTSFGRNLILSVGTTVDASADGLTVDTLTAASGATLKVTAGKPICVTAADGLSLGDGLKISLVNATTEGTFTLFETKTPVTAADLEKIKVVNADYGYIYTLSADGKNVKLVTEYHEPQEVLWNGGVSGGWMTADNWNGGKLPYANDTAVFPAAAETKAVVVDGDVRVAALSFPDVATYTLGGAGSVKGDVEVAGGKVSLVSPFVLAGEGGLCLKKGTFVGAADGLSFVRDVTIDANRQPVGLKADEDVSITGSLSVKSGMIVKLGDATVTMNLPEGTHTVAPVDGSTVPAIGNVATTVFDYDRESGEFASRDGLTAFNIVEGELGLVGAGASLTTVNNSRVTAIGIRGGETSSPSLSLRALTYNGGLDGSRTVVGTYYTNAVANPPALALSDGAVLNASEFVVGFKATSAGRFYVSVTNSVLSASTSLQLPYEGTSNDDKRRAVVTVDGADARVEYAATRTGDDVNGVVLGPVDLRLTDGAKLIARGTRPVRYSDHVRYGASVVVAGGATFSAPALWGANVFERHSGVTNAFDGGTLELTASATSLFANPEENVMVVGPNGATVVVGEGVTHRLAFPVIGSGALVKSGAGTLVLGKTLDWVSDAVTNECDATVLRTTGAVEIAEGALDFAGESVSLVLKPSQGEIRNATLAGVRVDLAGLEPEIGQRIPVVRLGSGVTANLGTWRLATRSPDYSACFVREGDIVVAEIVTKPGLMMIVR